MPGLFTIWLRRNIKAIQPLLQSLDMNTARKAQDSLGKIAARIFKGQISYRMADGLDESKSVWILPEKTAPKGQVLYLHGGGYCAGSLEYSKLFGGILAAKCNKKVFCLAYPLAPENPFPAAIDDAFAAYKYMLEHGADPKQLAVVGESAGGGLVFALLHKLKESGAPMPACAVGISPWTDLTCSASSYEQNANRDISLTKDQLVNFAGCYAPDENDRKDPLASPIFGSFDGFPPALVLAGDHEILLDDAIAVKNCYDTGENGGCTLVIEKGMWHVYPLYNTMESRAAVRQIGQFLDKHIK